MLILIQAILEQSINNKRVSKIQVGTSMSPGVDSYSGHFGTINK